MIEVAKNTCVDAMTHNSNLSTRKIVDLLSESELKIIVDKSTIARTLNNLDYWYKKTKLRVKNYDQQKMGHIDLYIRHINSTKFYPAFFTDECTFTWITLQEVDRLKLMKMA